MWILNLLSYFFTLIEPSCVSLFFSDRIASDRGAGHEIISGTPLKMPSHAEYEAFRKVVAQVNMFLSLRLFYKFL